MPTANLHNTGTSINTGNDSIVIKKNLETIPGGRTLDVTDYPLDVINAGHVIIEETATGTLKPMPLADGNEAYDSLPASHTYKGILVASILTAKPFAAVLRRGTVNPDVSPFPLTTILSAVKTALPLILFEAD